MQEACDPFLRATSWHSGKVVDREWLMLWAHQVLMRLVYRPAVIAISDDRFWVLAWVNLGGWSDSDCTWFG